MRTYRWKWGASLVALAAVASPHTALAATRNHAVSSPARTLSLSPVEVTRVNGAGFRRVNGILLTQRFITPAFARHGLLATYEESFSSRRSTFITDTTSQYRTRAGARWGATHARIASFRQLPGLGDEAYVFTQPHTSVVVFRQGTFVATISIVGSPRVVVRRDAAVRLAAIEDSKIRRHG